MILKPRLFRKPRMGHWATKGLVGLWLFNEGSGGQVFDLSGNGNAGTFAAGAASPLWTVGKYGPALTFDGGDYICIGDKSIYEGMAQLSIVAGVTSIAGSTEVIIAKAHTSNSYYLSTAGDKARLVTFTAGGEVTTTGTTNTLNKNICIAGVYDGVNQHVYVNGILEASDPQLGAINLSTSPLTIGALDSGAAQAVQFDGLIEFIYLFNRVLSASEIALLYREPFCMFERDPIELWSAATLGAAPPVGMAGAMTTNTGYWGW